MSKYQQNKNENNTNITYQQRNELLSSSSTSKSNRNKEAKKISESLKRTKQLMSQEINRVSEVNKTLDDDTVYLKDTKNDHDMLKYDSNKNAHYALRQLKMQEKKEDIIFWFSVIFYVMVSFYVLWCRLPIIGF